ncbi:oligosaccharide flippase family protein [Flavobacterium sp.]|uniref:oligosaccharide flippase family protein n=1 Tax=Flavobacterium sp. TaxID=239 RepID=UPI0037C0E6E3
MIEKKNTYRNILKATTIFGGVQVSSIIVSIIRSKFLAIFIGLAGYGIFSLLNSTIELVRALTSFGLETSGVKKISEVNSINDNRLISKNVYVILKLGLLTGILGTLTAMIFSNYLSRFSFGNSDKTIAVILISVSILFKQLTSSKNAIFQGMAKLNFLAKSNLYGNIFGLIMTLPLFYIFKIDAIVPAIIVTSFISFIVSVYYFKKLNIEKSSIKFNEILIEGKDVLYFGGLLSISSFLPVLSNYLIQIFISKNGGIELVGLFSVGLIIINSYVGILFNAMSTEYYPRLVSEISLNKNVNNSVNQQAIFSMLIIVPIIILFFGLMPIIIKILFTANFLEVMPFVSWAILAMFFKSFSWSMGLMIIAKADSKVFTKTSIIFNFLYLLICLYGYHFYGLEGLGIGFLLYFIIHLISVFFVVKWRYGLILTNKLYIVFVICLVLCIISIVLFHISNSWMKYILFLITFIFSVLFAYKELMKNSDLKESLISYFNRKKK